MNKLEITKHLKLPFHFDEQKLLADLNLILNSDWKAHFNKIGYSGNWSSIALYAPNGDHKNIFAVHNDQTHIQETELIKKCDYFKEVLKQIQCPLLSVRLLNLGVGAYIKPHKDYQLGYENGCFRLHIPIITNPKVEFILADKALTMLPGECWYTNVNYTHSVANNGDEDRIHLVIDGERNEWSDDLFFSLASKESLLTAEEIPHDKAYIMRTIEELEISKVSGYQRIVDDLKKKLKDNEEYAQRAHK